MSNEPARFRITVAYDGRRFEGWQSQPGGNTIQDQLLTILQCICPDIATVQGSGRTDAGVSAHGQVAHFDCPSDWRMDAVAWQKALNAQLPKTIRIMHCEAVEAEFHARFSAKGKIYRYRLFTGEVLPPLDYGLVWHRRNLSVSPFAEAMAAFEGSHYFRAFSANRNDGKDEGRHTGRTIFKVTTTEEANGYLSVDLHGSGFLYKMVRFMIGTGVYVADGKLPIDQVRKWLADPPEKIKAPYCAPPDGLSLLKVCYE